MVNMTTERAGHSDAHADTRVLQAVHKTFRLATTRLVDGTERLEPAALQPIIGSYWQFYAAVLHHHHHTEDTAVFPALVAVRPDLQALVDKLEAEHKGLVAALDAANSAVVAFTNQPDRTAQQEMHNSITAVRDEFFPHLDVEDAEVIPALAESIPPKEWDRLDKQALKSIPRPYLSRAVGALDEVIRGLPEAERPSGPPPPIRIMLAVSWRRKWAEYVKPITG
jgi:hemerythrin-like domain-containing protein